MKKFKSPFRGVTLYWIFYNKPKANKRIKLIQSIFILGKFQLWKITIVQRDINGVFYKNKVLQQLAQVYHVTIHKHVKGQIKCIGLDFYEGYKRVKNKELDYVYNCFNREGLYIGSVDIAYKLYQLEFYTIIQETYRTRSANTGWIEKDKTWVSWDYKDFKYEVLDKQIENGKEIFLVTKLNDEFYDTITKVNGIEY